jgi:hypothetical protein
MLEDIATLTENIHIDDNIPVNINENKKENEWNDNIENLLKLWGEKAAGHREIHMESAKYWKRISNRITVPIILFSTISSITTITAVDFNDYVYWMYAAASVNVLTAFLTSVNKFLKTDEYFQKHLSSSKAFGKYYRNIQLELSISRDFRQPSDTLSKWAKTEIDRLIQEAPVVSDDVIHLYNNKRAENSDIPDINNDNYTITIYGKGEQDL